MARSATKPGIGIPNFTPQNSWSFFINRGLDWGVYDVNVYFTSEIIPVKYPGKDTFSQTSCSDGE